MSDFMTRIESDYKEAFKAGQRTRIDTLRLIKAAVQRAKIDKRKDQLDDTEIIQVLSQQAKQRRETIEAVKQADRQDLLAQAEEELAILNGYLPQQLSDDAVRQLIDEALASVGKNQGPIMKYIMAKSSGTLDGKRVSRLVAERLQKG